MTHQQKNIALVIGTIITLWISYKFAFSETVSLKTKYQKLKEEENLYSNISAKLLQLKKEHIYYDSILASKNISSETSFQNNLLNLINSYSESENIRIIEFKNPHIIEENKAKVYTYSFTLEGSYNEITRLIYTLEKNNLGKIISLYYTKKRDLRRRTNYLECTILLQRLNK